MKAGESDFCSEACQSLADIRAPFLIEIPRGHVAFKTGTSPPYFLHPQNDVHACILQSQIALHQHGGHQRLTALLSKGFIWSRQRKALGRASRNIGE